MIRRPFSDSPHATASVCFVLTLLWVVSFPAHAHQLSRTAFSGGAVASSGGSFVLGATVAEAGVVGSAAGGGFILNEGFFSNAFRLIATDTPEQLESSVQLTNLLSPNFPNPFQSSTAITYAVARSEPVTLVIFDVSGRRVSTLLHGVHAPGRYRIEWSGRDDTGRVVASGIYLYQLQIGDWTKTRKMLKLR